VDVARLLAKLHEWPGDHYVGRNSCADAVLEPALLLRVHIVLMVELLLWDN
jgi:hypothetical protein